MIGGIFMLSLFAFAYADPPYAQFAEALHAAVHELDDQILSMDGNIPNITDSRRHYAVLVTHIALVANFLVKYPIGSTYEDTYIHFMPDNIALALTHVQDVIDETARAFKELDVRTQKIQALMKNLCLPPGTPEVCNQLVHQAVTGDPDRYDEEAQLLLTAGEAATMLLEKKLAAVADEHEEIKYLLDYQEDLKYLTLDLIYVIKKITN